MKKICFIFLIALNVIFCEDISPLEKKKLGLVLSGGGAKGFAHIGVLKVLDEEKILGVETGACPHTAVREDPSMNIAAVEDMEERFPDSDLIMIESGGDNLTLTFSPALADFYIYVIDVAEGEKIPRKNGPGLVQADILVINKIDLAPYVCASLDVMESDTKVVRGDRPYILTNCKTGQGIEQLVDMIMRDFLFTHVSVEGQTV